MAGTISFRRARSHFSLFYPFNLHGSPAGITQFNLNRPDGRVFALSMPHPEEVVARKSNGALIGMAWGRGLVNLSKCEETRMVFIEKINAHFALR